MTSEHLLARSERHGTRTVNTFYVSERSRKKNIESKSEKLLSPLIKRLPYLFVESLSRRAVGWSVARLRSDEEKVFLTKSRDMPGPSNTRHE